MNPSMGSRAIMSLMPASLFDMSPIPMGGWNLPPFEFHANYALLGASAQIGSFPTYYAPPTHLSHIMSVPSNIFSMTGCLWVFHTEKTNFTVQATLFTRPLHKGETYIITRIILIQPRSLRRPQ
jgi:hypothetical protein